MKVHREDFQSGEAESFQEPTAHTAVADKTSAGSGATAAMYKRCPKGAPASRAGKHGVAHQQGCGVAVCTEEHTGGH